jgi:hypothetical protein
MATAKPSDGVTIAVRTRVGKVATPVRMVADGDGDGEAVAVRYDGERYGGHADGSGRDEDGDGEARSAVRTMVRYDAAAAPVRSVAVRIATAQPTLHRGATVRLDAAAAPMVTVAVMIATARPCVASVTTMVVRSAE